MNNSSARTIATPIVLTGGAILTAVVVCMEAPLLPGMAALGLFVMLLAFSRLHLAGLAVACIIADHLCQFLKRAIFLLPDQTIATYYAFQMLPTMVLAAAFVSAIQPLRKVRFSASAYWMLAFGAICLVTTMVSPGGANFSARMSGINQGVVPIAAFFVGMAIPMTSWPKLAKIFLIFICISTPYGVYQLITGPTPIDLVWADATHAFSVEGWKVWRFAHHADSEFRAYSYYADHLTWGTFLANATIFVVACASIKMVPKSWRWWALGMGSIGILACETRGIWITFAATFLIYRTISIRGLRRPLLVLALVGASFAGVIVLGLYARANINIPMTSSRIINRALVVGTISARTSAPEIFMRVLPSHVFYGGGFGAGYLNAGLDENLKFTDDQFSHNMIVDMVITVGLPGELAFFCFIYFWIKEAFWVIRVSDQREARAVRWLTALFVGMLLSSGINTMVFLNFYFYLIAGLMCAEWSRKKQAYKNIPDYVRIPRQWEAESLAR